MNDLLIKYLSSFEVHHFPERSPYLLLHLYYFKVWRFSELRIFLFPNNLSRFAFVAAIIPCGLLRIIFLDFLIDLHDFQVKLVQFISVEDHSSL